MSDETLEAVNDLSEDFRKDIDEIYFALSQLAEKNKQHERQELRRVVGFRKPQKK